jgi:hypothetical protein
MRVHRNAGEHCISWKFVDGSFSASADTRPADRLHQLKAAIDRVRGLSSKQIGNEDVVPRCSESLGRGMLYVP